jgi:hypothetical protein
MKPFDELTDDEIVALTDERVQFYKDLACAEAGAPLSLPAPVVPSKPEVVDDATLYMVGNLCFSDATAAQAVADLANQSARFDTAYISGPSYRKYAKPDTDQLTVSPIRLLSQQTAQAMREQIETYEREKAAYQKDQQEYDKATKLRGEATSWISARIAEAHANVFERDEMRRQYERYVALAEGNTTIAARFLAKAFGERARRSMPELFVDGEVMPATPLDAPATAEEEVVF